MIIKNGSILKDTFVFEPGSVLIENGLIAKVGECESYGEVFDAEGGYVVPGFIDTHMHGAMGEEYTDWKDGTYEKIARFEAQNGTTSLVPTLGAQPDEIVFAAMDRVRYYKEHELKDGSHCLGIHLEGPYLCEKYRGAHRIEYLRTPDCAQLQRWIDHAGKDIKVLAIAPELENAEAVTRLAVQNGITVSAGHTDATFEQTMASREWGLSQGTHLFNVMSPLKHREPGTVGALLYGDFDVEVIGDFMHVLPPVVKLVWKLKGPERFHLITDAVTSAGLPDGDYESNGLVIRVKDHTAKTLDGAVAGGYSTLIDCVRNLVSLDIPLADAVRAATEVPAKSIREYDRIGSLTPGKQADIVVLNKDLSIKAVFISGQRI